MNQRRSGPGCGISAHSTPAALCPMSEEEDWFEQALRETADVDEEAPDPSVESDWFDAEPEEEFVDDGEVDDGELFDADFATALSDAPFPSDDEDDAARSSGFDDEEFDSSLPRLDVGVPGLDEMIQGGVPERSLLVAIGAAGTGKTTFGIQFVNQALALDEYAVFISLEETRERVVATAEDRGWPFREYQEEGRLAIVDLDPVELANSLTSVGNELPGLVQEFGASRLVLDSVSLLEMMYDDQAARRNEIFDFTNSLKQAGVTTFLTSEASERDPYHSRFGIIEYLTDAVFVLRYIRPDDYRETRLAVEIQKIRDANHSRELKPYEITNEGLSVYRQANIF